MKTKIARLAMLITALCGYQIAQACAVTPANCEKKCWQKCYNNLPNPLLRAFSSYSEHDILQEQDALIFKAKNDRHDHEMFLGATTEYSQNFGNKCGTSCGSKCNNLGILPFWSGTNTMTIGNNDGKADIDAWQFGLGNVIVNEDGIAGTIQLNPRVQTIGSDILLYYSHHKNEPSFFFKLHAPIGAIMINPCLKEPMVAEPDDVFALTQTTASGGELNPSSTITYVNKDYPCPDRRYVSMSHSLFGGLPGDSLQGNIVKPVRLRQARIAPSKLTEIRLSDLSFSLGYNFIAKEKGLLGVAFKATCPTGNVLTADYALQPIFGRGGYWGVGGEVMGNYRVWQNDDETRSLHVALQGECLHLVPGRVPNYRTFDLLLNGAGSRYLLVQYYPALINGLTGGTPDPNFVQLPTPTEIQPAANLTTLPAISKIAVEGSVAVMATLECHNWTFDLGAEFWGRSQEKLSIDMKTCIALRLQNLNDYAVIGRQVGTYLIDGQPDPLVANLCEPLATISKSQDPIQLVGTVPNVEVPTTLPDGIKDATDSKNRIPADLTEALDICGAQAPSVFTGKLFGAFGYTWVDAAYIPSIKLFGGVEFANNNTVAQLWSVGLVGNIQF